MDKLVILTGPTAVGKTALSIALAKKINGEIISADCMQVYKYMDIGTAKITNEEMQGVKHYLIDCVDPGIDFNVVEFKKMAQNAIEEIKAKGKIPIICGGTGFYIQALLYDIQFTPCEIDEAYRNELEEYAKVHGNEALHELLKECDLESYNSIPANNVKRVIRALEYNKNTNKTISEHNKEERQRKSPYNFAYFVLNDDREKLYNRINARVDKMVSDGLEDEVKALLNRGYKKGLTSMDGIGYKEIIDYLQGDTSFDQAIDIIKQSSRRYAKRQLTWFRREKEVNWLDKSFLDDEQILNNILNILSQKGIIN